MRTPRENMRFASAVGMHPSNGGCNAVQRKGADTKVQSTETTAFLRTTETESRTVRRKGPHLPNMIRWSVSCTVAAYAALSLLGTDRTNLRAFAICCVYACTLNT